MKVTITFLHLDHTEALDQRIHEKTEKLEKFFEKDSTIKWTCYVKGGQHYAEINASGTTLHHHAIAHSDNMYKTLDMAVDKMLRQAQKKVEKRQNKIHRGKAHLHIVDPSEAWGDFESHPDYDYDDIKQAA